MIQAAEHARSAAMITPETPIRPQFARPPLIEQAFSVVFEPIEEFSIVDYGLFWETVASQLPQVTSGPPLEPPLETFDEKAPQALRLSLRAGYELPRAMFRNDSGELVQLQPDRFGFNWAKEGEAEYPRSEAVMARFEELFAAFTQYLEERGLAPPKLTQCELTNLNVLPVREFGNSFSDMTNALAVDPLDLGLPYLSAETYVRNRQHRILNSEGDPVGRLHTAILPVMSNQDGSQAFKLEITARSAPIIKSVDDARWFFGIARNCINGAFIATVTPDMRHKWGEQHV